MKSDKLINSNPPFKIKEAPVVFPKISGIAFDSRAVLKGDLFIAVKGFSFDGHKYIAEAEKKGAALIVCQSKQSGIKVPQLVVSDSRRALSFFSALYYGFPSIGINIIGVTGTNGKTTTCALIEDILKKSGKKTGIIGTIKLSYPLKDGRIYEKESLNTTPESAELQKTIYEMKKNNVTDIVMEVSSHSIALGRIDDVLFNTIVYTNLTQDHLDFHKSMEEYASVKSDFIIKNALESKKEPPFTAVNIDDQTGKLIAEELKTKNFTKLLEYSTEKKAFLQASDLKTNLKGSRGKIKFKGKTYNFSSHLFGKHNVENILAAVSACITSGISIENCINLLETSKPVRGRLEQVENTKRPYVFIDYAHTPDALENVLNSLRPLCKKRLISVFGCGGDRDIKKRPLMAEISARMAEITIITSDNPRTENQDKIISDIKAGLTNIIPEKDFLNITKNDKNIYFIEKNRQRAIEKALLISDEKDCILIAGKGHETYQIIGRKKFKFDDREVVLKKVEEIYGN
ncbi:MAG: UDP-N-acetylmuramoyl-L-alanyl-D-glutamate--2,6-diaminopimelate ligase [Desulforegulaceae bacterium]|nr:UDP-N-acetylmuramoyl-L-alanyl-D-glutamate--2,6-diaminopimelate ligase [Desulforegulaceae bacterium]